MAPPWPRRTATTPETISASTLSGASTVTSQVDTTYGRPTAVAKVSPHSTASASSTRSITGMPTRLSRKRRAKNRPNTAARHRPAGGETLFHHSCPGHRNW